jgi:hypothetical protein
VGHLANAGAVRSVAIGEGASTLSDNVDSLGTSVAIGNLAVASDEDAVAIGDQATASGFHSTAIGGESLATNAGDQAFGWQAEATGGQATAVGRQAVASGFQSTAVGQSASAGFDGSTAIGFGATTTREAQVVLGGEGSSVTVGDIDASTAAQSGTVYMATVDASGTLGRGVDISQMAQYGTQIDELFSRSAQMNDRINRANEGVAMGLAMESPMLPAGTSFALSGGVGYFADQGAGTMAFSARVSDTAAVSAGVGVGFDSGEVGARGGFQIAW